FSKSNSNNNNKKRSDNPECGCSAFLPSPFSDINSLRKHQLLSLEPRLTSFDVFGPAKVFFFFNYSRETDTERQKDRETKRETERPRERQRDRETERQRDRETERQRDRE